MFLAKEETQLLLVEKYCNVAIINLGLSKVRGGQRALGITVCLSFKWTKLRKMTFKTSDLSSDILGGNKFLFPLLFFCTL